MTLRTTFPATRTLRQQGCTPGPMVELSQQTDIALRQTVPVPGFLGGVEATTFVADSQTPGVGEYGVLRLAPAGDLYGILLGWMRSSTGDGNANTAWAISVVDGTISPAGGASIRNNIGGAGYEQSSRTIVNWQGLSTNTLQPADAFVYLPSNQTIDFVGAYAGRGQYINISGQLNTNTALGVQVFGVYSTNSECTNRR